jgi:HEAT repeat protein
MAGSDRYTSWIVSQGVGHDLAFGLLLDEGGDDVYEASGQSQGFGNANGIGILADAAGNDRYVGEAETVQGYGQRDQTFESLGFLMDGGGSDVYSGLGRDDTLWRRGEIGIGLDAEGISLGLNRPAPILPLPPSVPLPTPSVYAVAPPPSEELVGREGMEALEALREASRLGPRPEQEPSRRAAKERLVAMREKAVPLLVYTLRSADITRVMVAMEVLEKMGKETVPALAETLRQPIQPSRRRAASLLARIADPSTTPPLLQSLEDGNPGVRAAAARGLGRIGNLPAAGWSALAERVRRDPSRNVRWEAITALGGADSATVVPVLLDALADSDFTVRFAAERALLRLGAKSRELLRQFLTEPPRGEALDQTARALAQTALNRLSGVSDP